MTLLIICIARLCRYTYQDIEDANMKRFCDPAVVTCSQKAAASDPISFYLPTQKQFFRFRSKSFCFCSPSLPSELVALDYKNKETKRLLGFCFCDPAGDLTTKGTYFNINILPFLFPKRGTIWTLCY